MEENKDIVNEDEGDVILTDEEGNEYKFTFLDYVDFPLQRTFFHTFATDNHIAILQKINTFGFVIFFGREKENVYERVFVINAY